MEFCTFREYKTNPSYISGKKKELELNLTLPCIFVFVGPIIEFHATQLLQLLDKYGKEKMLEGMHICVKRGKFSPGYLEGCITHAEGKSHREIINPFTKLIEERSDQDNDNQ